MRTRGPNISPEIKNNIAIMKHRHPKWTAKIIQEKLSQQLRRENPKLPPNYPSLSAVEKELARQSKNIEEGLYKPELLGSPWSIQRLADEPIPPEAIPSVLRVWVWMKENWDEELTVEQAIWAGRLYAVAKDDIEHLAWLAKTHSFVETISKITGQRIDMHEADLDALTRAGWEKLTGERIKKVLGISEEEWLTQYKKGYYYQKYVEPAIQQYTGVKTKGVIMGVQNEGKHKTES